MVLRIPEHSPQCFLLQGRVCHLYRCFQTAKYRKDSFWQNTASRRAAPCLRPNKLEGHYDIVLRIFRNLFYLYYVEFLDALRLFETLLGKKRTLGHEPAFKITITLMLLYPVLSCSPGTCGCDKIYHSAQMNKEMKI